MTLLRVHRNTYVALFVIYCTRLDICNVLYLLCSHTVGDAWSLLCWVYTQLYFVLTAYVAWSKYYVIHCLKSFPIVRIILKLSKNTLNTKEAARSVKRCSDPRHSAMHAFVLFVMFVASLWTDNLWLTETHRWIFCLNSSNAYRLYFFHIIFENTRKIEM